MIKALITLAASIAGYFFSEDRRKAKAQAERDRIAAEVAAGDEDKVNARLGRFRCVPWILAGLLVMGGCYSQPKAVYVREADRVRALRPGMVHTNVSEAVEWIVPRSKMTKLVIEAEG